MRDSIGQPTPFRNYSPQTFSLMFRKIFGVLLLATAAFAFGACDKDNNEKRQPTP